MIVLMKLRLSVYTPFTHRFESKAAGLFRLAVCEATVNNASTSSLRCCSYLNQQLWRRTVKADLPVILWGAVVTVSPD